MTNHSALTSIEADCWSRDFHYDQYCDFCKRYGLTPVHKRTYAMLVQAFDEQMEYWMEINND